MTITLNPHQAAICHFLSFAGSLIIHEFTTWKVLYLSLQPQSCQFSLKQACLCFQWNAQFAPKKRPCVYDTTLHYNTNIKFKKKNKKHWYKLSFHVGPSLSLIIIFLRLLNPKKNEAVSAFRAFGLYGFPQRPWILLPVFCYQWSYCFLFFILLYMLVSGKFTLLLTYLLKATWVPSPASLGFITSALAQNLS